MTASLLTQGTFFFPGPTEVRTEVLAAMTRPLIAHRERVIAENFIALAMAILRADHHAIECRQCFLQLQPGKPAPARR